MAEASLREYCNKAKELIEAGALDESISLCQHILRWYPKHIETYQLLGEACLEKGDHYEAIDLFKRVLSAGPENFISYVGLSIIYDSEGAINESIWQLERAFELAPGNSEVRKELQRLYGLRDGTAPRRLKLTRGALGRLYSKDELFPQAIDEYEYLLQGDPERVDLQLAEAEALWRHGRKREAVEACQDVLAKLPNCLKANLILAKIWLENDLKSEAEPLLDMAQQLDAENRMAEALFGPDSPLRARTATLPKMSQELQELEVTAEASGTPAGTSTSADELPDWLRATGKEGAPAHPLQDKEKAPLESTVSAPSAEDEPSIALWVQALRTMVPDEVSEVEESTHEKDIPLQASSAELLAAEAIELEADVTSEVASDQVPQPTPIGTSAGPSEMPKAQLANGTRREDREGSEVEVGSPSWFQQIRPASRDGIEEEAPSESAAEDSILDEAIAKAYPPRSLPPLEAPAWAQELRATVPDEWLKSGQETTPSPEAQRSDAPWVRSLRESVPQAQPEAPAEDIEAQTISMRPGGVETEPKPEMGLEEAKPAAPENAPPEAAAEGPQKPQDHAARLTWARAHMARGDVKAACQQYEMILNEAPELVGQVISDLEKRLAEGKTPPLLHRLLGDAYLKDGQLDKALDAYRTPLDEM